MNKGKNYSERNSVLLKEYTENLNKSAFELLVKNNLPLVTKCIKHYLWTTYEYDDLFQTGCVGLIKAIKKFKPEFGVELSTYAVPMIIGEVKRMIRDDNFIKISRKQKVDIRCVHCMFSELTTKYGYEPSIAELANAVNMTPKRVLELLEIEKDITLKYLSDKICDSESKEITLEEKLMDKTCEEDSVIDKMFLKTIINKLNYEEKTIILLRYYEDKTQVQVAKILGTSQVQVSRIEKKCLSKLREEFKYI